MLPEYTYPMNRDVAPHWPADLLGLMHPDAYPHAVRGLQVLETHLSWVILTGQLAYKIKRPVRLPFVDTCSLFRRAQLCHEEVRLNRPWAPEIYLEVCPITRSDNGLRIGGPGDPIEYAVRMRQFDRAQELDQLVREDRLAAEELIAFGTSLARWHAELPPLEDHARFDSPDAVAALIATNAQECVDVLAACGFHDSTAALVRRLLPYVAMHGEARAAGNRFREGHGDLHLANLVRIDHRIIPFDGLEFDRRLRCVDVADEVGFLCVDLVAFGRVVSPRHS